MENAEEIQEKKKKKGLSGILKTLVSRIIGVFREYPVTMIAIMLAALAFSLVVGDLSREVDKFLTKFATVCLITATGSLFLEELFPKKKILRIAGYCLSAVSAVVYVAIFYTEKEMLLGLEANVVRETAAKLLALQGVILIGFAIWHMYRRLEEDFEVYATKAFVELIKATVIYGLFAAGLAIIVLIFNALIFDTDDFLSQVEIFLASGIYVPMCLKAISGKNEEPGKFFRVCIQYVLLPMLLISFAIIYLYIAKVFITNDIPSNKIFYILTGLFSIGMPIWTCVHGLRQKEGFLTKAAAFLPYVFLPFVLLQGWSIGLRIGQYGITEPRYFGIVMILCEIIYFGLYVLHHRGNKQAISWGLFAAMAVTFFSLLCPGTTYDDVTIHSQMSRMKKMLASANPTAEEKSSIKNCYREIKNVGYKGKKALESQLSKEQTDRIGSYDEYGNLTHDTVYLHSHKSNDYIEVAGYSRIYEINTDSGQDSYLGDGKLKLQYANYERRKNSEPILADVSELVDYALTFTESYDPDFSIDNYRVCPVNDHQAIWVTNFTISFYEDTKKINTMYLNGYLMEK